MMTLVVGPALDALKVEPAAAVSPDAVRFRTTPPFESARAPCRSAIARTATEDPQRLLHAGH